MTVNCSPLGMTQGSSESDPRASTTPPSGVRNRLRSLTPPRGLETLDLAAAGTGPMKTRLRSLTPPRDPQEDLIVQLAGQLPGPSDAPRPRSPVPSSQRAWWAVARNNGEESPAESLRPRPLSSVELSPRGPLQLPFSGHPSGEWVGTSCSPSAWSSASPSECCSPAFNQRVPWRDESPSTSTKSMNPGKHANRGAFDGLFAGFKSQDSKPRTDTSGPSSGAPSQTHDLGIYNLPHAARGSGEFEPSEIGLYEDDPFAELGGQIPSKPVLPKRMPRRWKLPSSYASSAASGRSSHSLPLGSRPHSSYASGAGTPQAVSSESLPQRETDQIPAPAEPPPRRHQASACLFRGANEPISNIWDDLVQWRSQVSLAKWW